MIGLPDGFNLWEEEIEDEDVLEEHEFKEHYSARHEEFANRWAVKQEH